MNVTKMHADYKNGVRVGTKAVNYTVAEAVKATLEDMSFMREGEFERLRERLDQTNELVSQLVQMLADSGALKVGHVNNLVGSDFKVTA